MLPSLSQSAALAEIKKVDGIFAMPDDVVDYEFTLAKNLGARAEIAFPDTKRLGKFADKHKMMVGYQGHATTSALDFETAVSHAAHNGPNLDIGHCTAHSIGSACGHFLNLRTENAPQHVRRSVEGGQTRPYDYPCSSPLKRRAASFCIDGNAWAYVPSVISILLCPRRCCTTCAGTPAFSNSVGEGWTEGGVVGTRCDRRGAHRS